MKNIIKNTNKKGFTIVELVIVIAVIAILAGVLIPTFSSIITKAKNSATLQEADTIYTMYIANVDYKTGATPDKDLVIKVEDNKFVVVKDSKLLDDIYSTAQAGANAKLSAGTYKVVYLEGENVVDNVTTVTVPATGEPNGQ